jgi:hypothetical protein
MRSSSLVVVLTLLASCAMHSASEVDSGSEPMGCTDIGCHDGLVVSVLPTSSWPHGAYRFTIEADETTTICTGALPLPDCNTRAITCDADEPMITESGCALSESTHAFGDIVFSSTPASVAIAVTLDDDPIATETWTPTYQTFEPNGPGCPPKCTSAAVTLDLSFD